MYLFALLIGAISLMIIQSYEYMTQIAFPILILLIILKQSQYTYIPKIGIIPNIVIFSEHMQQYVFGIKILHFYLDQKSPKTLQAIKAEIKINEYVVRKFGKQVPKTIQLQNLFIQTNSNKIPIRSYKPPQQGPLPTLIFIHGGGFVIGNINQYDGLCGQIAAQVPCVVVSVEYRKAPEYKFPAAPDDCFNAYKYVVENIKDFGQDPQKIAVGGDSAGGNLAAVTALQARDQNLPLAFQLLIYPPTNANLVYQSCLENFNCFSFCRKMMWYQQMYFNKAEEWDDWRASPIKANLKDVADAHVITAQLDLLRDDGIEYAKKLKNNGVNVSYKHYMDTIHGFFGLDVVNHGHEAFLDVIEVLREKLK